MRGIFYILSAISIGLTEIPLAPDIDQCTSFPDTFWSALLSYPMRGKSNPVVLVLLFYFTVIEYTSTQAFPLRWMSTLLTASSVFCLIASHLIYTNTLMITYWAFSRIWWLYHSVVNCPCLRGQTHDLPWAKIVNYLESNWTGPVPHQIGCPIPKEWRHQCRVCFQIFNNVQSI